MGNITRIPKDKQIKGIKKALKNPRTPKQFMNGLKKRLKNLQR